MQDLEREGFVIRIPHKGTFVTEIDSVNIVETFQIRAQLEGMAVRLATPQLKKQDFDEIERLLKLANEALAQGEREQCSVYGARFHQCFCFIRHAGNKRLAAILSNLEDHLQRFRHISDLISGRLEKSQAEHHAVFEAAFQGDAEKAGKAMYNHLNSIVQNVQNAAGEWSQRVGGNEQ